MSASEFILEIRGLNKFYGATHANKNISLNLKRGEIKGLIGENGSGKSTLISQIAGMFPRDSGEMILNGEPYNPFSPLDANAKKISMVVQELGVINNLPVGVNVFLGRTGQFTKYGIVNIKQLYKEANEQFEKWNLPKVALNQLADGLTVENRKLIELTRALSIDPDILLLDEITQSLSHDNRNRLYELIKKFKAMGKSVILITHDVEEMIEITDSITVLRDGEVVGEVLSANTAPNKIKSLMVGREVSGEYYREDKAPIFDNEVVLDVKDLTVEGELEDISFEVHRGEILGFCGLSDSGIHSVGKAVYGLSKLKRGSVYLQTKGVSVINSEVALKSGMAYVPKDRDGEALMIDASILDNICLPSLTELKGRLGYLKTKKLKKLAEDASKELSIKCTGITQNMCGLSGGNKQKVNLGRWLAKDLELLVLDCPTRGVDVGVKTYIYSLMKESKKKGIAMILISDELTEVIGMADRLYVMKDGKISGIISRDENLTEHSVIEVMI